MGTLLILIVLIAVVVGAIIVISHADNNMYNSEVVVFPVAILACVVFVITVVWGIAWVATSVDSRANIQRMEAFREATIHAYEYTIDETENVVIAIDDFSLTDFTYQQQGLAVSERIKELRNQVLWYNSTLAQYRGWNDNFFLSGMYADVPDDWTYIILESDD